MFTRSIIEYFRKNGGRVSILFLLFLLAVFSFHSMGIGGFALICMLPLFPVLLWISFKHKMTMFWTLFVCNYFIMGYIKYKTLPCPVSLPCELLELTMLMSLFIDNKESKFSNLGNVMLFALMMWLFFACIEMFNDTCNLGFHIIEWLTEARLLVFQLLYVYIIFTLLITDYHKIINFLYVWAIFSVLAAFWSWKQKTFGFTDQEMRWLRTGPIRTHIIGGTIRYFSFFSDAANFGCSMAASSIAFFIFGLTAHLKRDRILFILTGCFCAYGMLTSGTRTAIFCFFLGGFLYIFLSKSIKISIPVTIIGLVLFFILAFTQIGQNNPMIRRMRTAFDKNDASANVRDINKASIRKYLRQAPWGMGLGMDVTKVPANNKYKILLNTPPDSTYVYIWVHTGVIGVTIFTLANILILLGGCHIVLFKLKNKTISGIGAAFCCAFISINIGGYANQILTQYPNTFLYYGSMAIVYLLPKVEPEFIKFEEEDNKRIEEEKKKKEDKKKNPYYV
jgi:teichuronic acid biosynthesis protein TuaE